MVEALRGLGKVTLSAVLAACGGARSTPDVLFEMGRESDWITDPEEIKKIDWELIKLMIHQKLPSNQSRILGFDPNQKGFEEGIKRRLRWKYPDFDEQYLKEDISEESFRWTYKGEEILRVIKETNTLLFMNARIFFSKTWTTTSFPAKTNLDMAPTENSTLFRN